MDLKFQYNKTSLQRLKRQLLIRQKALPILKNKETALRQEAKTLSKDISLQRAEVEKFMKEHEAFDPFWTEFPAIVSIERVALDTRNVVGVKLPVLGKVHFKIRDISWVAQPAWVPVGIEVLKEMLTMEIQIKIAQRQLQLLLEARKKTTQKANLYEKMQIPALQEAMVKIKRFIEDKENIAKAAQKIMKKRHEQQLSLA